MSEMVKRVRDALRNANVGYSISLTRLVDGVSTYEVVIHGDCCMREFSSHEEALEYVTERREEGRARAAIETLREPTELMLCAGEDVRFNNLPTEGIWRAMIDEVLK